MNLYRVSIKHNFRMLLPSWKLKIFIHQLERSVDRHTYAIHFIIEIHRLMLIIKIGIPLRHIKEITIPSLFSKRLFGFMKKG